MCSMILFITFITTAIGSHFDPCPAGWSGYNQVLPKTKLCLFASDDKKKWDDANTVCSTMNASLFKTDSEAKYQRLKDISETLPTSPGQLIPLFKFKNGLFWLSKNGYEKAAFLPKELANFPYWYDNDNPRNKDGVIYFGRSTLYRLDQVGSATRYICEKRANCNKGWFGLECDKECHCHAHQCHPLDLEVTCPYGCEIGWMGKDCSTRKQEAAVRYFCVNAPLQGKYAHLRISTKGVHYDYIGVVDRDGRRIPWCNSTDVNMDNELGVMTVKIYVDDSQGIKGVRCAGETLEYDQYEWRVKIQERRDVVSRNDKVVKIKCDFQDADNFQTTGDVEIKHERHYRRPDAKIPVKYIDEVKETIELQVVDPSDGKEAFEKRIGSAVALKLTFPYADGVIPHNCFASSPDLTKNATFLDENGCPSAHFHISAFYKNDSKTLITKPFPLFGFEEHETVEFHCSYVLCFENDPCPLGCYVGGKLNETFSHRHRRSTRAKALKLSGYTGVKSTSRMVRSPSHRRQEQTLTEEIEKS